LAHTAADSKVIYGSVLANNPERGKAGRERKRQKEGGGVSLEGGERKKRKKNKRRPDQRASECEGVVSLALRIER